MYRNFKRYCSPWGLRSKGRVETASRKEKIMWFEGNCDILSRDMTTLRELTCLPSLLISCRGSGLAAPTASHRAGQHVAVVLTGWPPVASMEKMESFHGSGGWIEDTGSDIISVYYNAGTFCVITQRKPHSQQTNNHCSSACLVFGFI